MALVTYYNNITNMFSAKTYEEWVNDFTIEIVAANDIFKVKYTDACSINNKICPTYNTYQLYENYIFTHQCQLVIQLSLIAAFLSFVIIQIYKYCRSFLYFCCFIVVLMYSYN